MLPHDPKELREAVRQAVSRTSATNVNQETFARTVECIALDARAAGIRAALALLTEARLKPRGVKTESAYVSPLSLYIDGYDHAIKDMMELLQLESEGS
jgi:hypothetical protein